MKTTSKSSTKCANRRLFAYAFAAALYLIVGGPLTRPAAAQSFPSVKTDRGHYPEPSPLPARPAVNVQFSDAVFGTQIIRATDENDCPSPGCSTFYANWPVFNSNNTYLLFRNSNNGNSDGRIRAFDPGNFRVVGASFFPGFNPIPGAGGVVMDFQSAYWHPTNPNVIYCFPNTGASPVPMALYTFTINGTPGVYQQVRDFTSLRSPGNGGSANDYLAQMSMSADGNVFAFNVRRLGAGALPVAYLVWNKATDQISYTPIPNQDVNEVTVDKSGQYLYITKEIPACANTTCPHFVRSQIKTLSTGHIENLINDSSDHAPSHGAIGTGIATGADSVSGGYNVRSLNNPHAFTTAFDGRISNCDPNADPYRCVDWTNEPTASLHSDDESWLTISTHKSWDSMVGPNAHIDRHLFEKEIALISLDGSQRIRRLAHTYSEYAPVSPEARTLSGLQPTASNDYWAIPHASISKDGRYIAYTSNWGNSSRYDLFILRVPNPIDESEFFVRQHYLDFLGREPDAGGLAFWTNGIESCGADAACRSTKRVDTSAAFFLSIEFRETGFLAYRAWGAAFGTTRVDSRWPLTRDDFLPDASRLGQNLVVGLPGWVEHLEANKAAYFNEFVARPLFAAAYPPGMTAEQFVDALNQNAGWTLSAAERDQLVSELSSGAKTRAQVLRAVAENPAFTSTQNNPAFVTMEYFGYLRRDPDPLGYDGWLGKLNAFGGDWRAAQMVTAFIESLEYRNRFGQ